MAGTACLCCGERPAFFFSLLALTIITFHPQRYNKQVFLREGENTGENFCKKCRPTSPSLLGVPCLQSSAAAVVLSSFLALSCFPLRGDIMRIKTPLVLMFQEMKR